MAMLLVAPWSGARAETRYVVSRDYQYGGSSAGDSSEWRPVTWVWRSASGRAACLESVLTDPAARRDPLETPACRRARLAPVRHRSTVDVLAANPECGPLTTIAFAPPGEGIAGVTVAPDAGAYFAVTAAGGGYAIPILAAGSYAVRFSGGGVPARTQLVEVGATSELLDYVVPEPGVFAGGALALFALAGLRRRH